MKMINLNEYVEKNFTTIEKNTPGIYCFLCVETSQFYVGKTKHVIQRKQEHIDLLNKGKHHSYKFQKLWDQYGEDAFKFYVIEYTTQLDKLNVLEPYWINKLDAIKSGLNIQVEDYDFDSVDSIKFSINMSESQRLKLIEDMSNEIIDKYFNLNSYPIYKIEAKKLYRLINFLNPGFTDESILKEILEYISAPMSIEEGIEYYYMYDLSISTSIKRKITLHNKAIRDKIEVYYNSPLRKIEADMLDHAKRIYENIEKYHHIDFENHILIKNDLELRKKKLLLEKAELEEEVICIY